MVFIEGADMTKRERFAWRPGLLQGDNQDTLKLMPDRFGASGRAKKVVQPA
jgi:hypothetical protein